MGVVFTPESNYAKEMVKHEAYPTRFGPGQRPFKHYEFPKMLYKATKGGVLPEFDHTTVGDEDEQRNMQSRGYCLTQELALEALRDEHTEHGKLAAERNYEIAKGRISEKAAAEVRAAEEAHGAKHLPVVPETPIRPRAKKADSTVVVPNKRHAKA